MRRTIAIVCTLAAVLSLSEPAHAMLNPCTDPEGAAQAIRAANPGSDPATVMMALFKAQELYGCRQPAVAAPTYVPAPSYATPTPPAYSPPASAQGSTTCMPFGNGGTRCTTMVPGQRPTYTTCYPFGNGGTRCNTQ
jgi:hypothetical protein